MKYSFVLPAYKARFFREAIDSILNQTYSDFELIIVNDASPQDLDSIVNSYSDEHIRYYKNEKNIGGQDLVAQWNKCLSYANTDYIILASDDDVYSPSYLEEMDKLVCKYPGVSVFRPRVKRVDEKGNICHIDGYLSEYLSKVEYLFFWTSCLIGSGIPFFIFKREALMSIGGFVNYPLAWFSDDATVLKLADNGIVICNKTLFSFRESGENISTYSNTKESLCAKYSATKMFSDEFQSFINNFEPKTEEDKYLMPFVKKLFVLLINKSKIRSQLKRTSLSVILGTMNYAVELGFSRTMLLKYCKYPIVSALKNIFSFNRK